MLESNVKKKKKIFPFAKGSLSSLFNFCWVSLEISYKRFPDVLVPSCLCILNIQIRQDAYDKHVVLQESGVLNSSSRDWGIGEGDTHETPWKLTTSSPTRYSGTLDHPHAGRFLGSRSRLVRIADV